MSINRHVMELLLGFALATLVYTATASLAFAAHKPNHNPGGGDGDDGGTHTYSVVIVGTLSPAQTQWPATGPDPGGGSNPVHVTAALDLDLRFFFDEIDEKFGAGRGAKCFGDGVPVPGVIVILVIREEKGSVVVRHTFTGYADDGTTEVNYVLEMFGSFDDDVEWRPVNDTHVVTLNSWEMTINTGGGVKNIACLGAPDPSDPPSDPPFLTFIAVTQPPIFDEG